MGCKDLNSCLSQINVLNHFRLRFVEESVKNMLGENFPPALGCCWVDAGPRQPCGENKWPGGVAEF
jgi:hypothetical protein